ncbi:MAG: alpha/beta hydrolase [Pseudobdellovibrio sp.]|nr:alpha/beta hydrolase [Pseudobdellovibrio sp.]
MNLKNSFWILIVIVFFTSCSSHIIQVEYKTKDQHTLKADLFLPKEKSEKPLPLVVVIHGGGWRNRSGDMEGICKYLAEKGFAALNITYRFVPEYRYPVQVSDVKAAIPWILEHAPKYNLNTQNISIWGYSAGAHLAFLLGNQKDLGTGIHAIVVGGIPSYFPSYPDSPLITPFMGVKYIDDPKTWLEASPLNFVGSETPPTFIYHGVDDSLVGIDQAEMLAAKLMQYKVTHQFFRVENRGHLTTYYFAQEAEDKAIEFLKSTP